MPKCNVRRKAQLGLDIREGGIAIPIAPNMYYMDGRSHNNGGITIGPNNKNGLEVEGGEVVKVGKNDVKVFSSVPLLRGVSPAQLVMGGANPDTVFKAQEEFKDRNRINDDGTTYQNGGQKKSNSAIRTEADKKVPAYNRAVYSLVDPTMGYPTKKEAFGYAIGAGIKAMRNPNDMVYWVTDSVSDAAWRKRHGLSYDNKFLIPNEDGSVRLPKDREMEIPTDTTMLKNRIAANEKLAKRYPEGSEKRDIVDWALKVDGMALDSLRHTYRTGKPVTINEGAYNSRRLINNGELSYPGIMPHNVMQNYAIQYDKSKDKMNYWDTYNFNQFEWGVPGKPFEIKGSIPLKKAGGIYIKPSKRGTFTAAATKHGMGVQEFASKVLANKEDYSPAMVKKANFARNANRWKKEYGGDDTKTAALKRLKNKFTIAGKYGDGMFGGAGAGSVIMEQPEYVTDTITKRYLVPVTQNFNDAFRDARNSGKTEFMFDGKLYNTNLGDNPNNNTAGFNRTSTIIVPIEHKEIRRRKKEFGGSMIYTINGNVKTGLNLRPKAKYGLASKYLKKKNKTTQKPVETKQKEEPKILDIRNTAGYKVKQVVENPWVKYPFEVASYLLTGATAKGMQTGAKVVNKAINKIDDILGKPRQEYLSRNVSDKTISYTTNSKSSVGSTYKATSKDLNRAKKEVQNRPTINDLAEARSTVGNVPQHTTISYNSSPQNPVSTINYFDVKNTRLPNIERFGRKQMDAKTSRELDKVYRKAVGNKEPKSGFGRIPQQTTIEYIPKGESVTAYDASAEFHKRISDMLYNNLVKKYGKKGVDKAMKAERISKYEYGGRIKAKNGKFLKYKNGVFTDPETGEQFDVDPEVFKMYGNTKESGVIPTADYTKGTFNARPQFYAEKRLPIAGSQSIAEKVGLSRSGWSYGENPTFDYVPNINISVPTNYSKAVGDNSKKSTSSTPRGEVTKTSTPKSTTKTTTKGADVKYGTPLKEKKESLYMTGIKNNSITPLRAGMEKIKSPSSTGGGTQPKDGHWIPQFKTTTTGDWLGLGANLAGHIASYFVNNSLLKKYPMPNKPIMTPVVKLKTKHNIESGLTNINETTQVNRGVVRRNTQSSNTSLAREQRLANEARNAKNQLYGQKENIETQLINQDRRNRQDVYSRNVAAYNDWLNKTYVAKSNQLLSKQQNMMKLINGIPMAVNNIIGTIESRRATNNTIKAIAAANPNVDGRMFGIGDYYTQRLADGRTAIYNKNHKLVKYV